VSAYVVLTAESVRVAWANRVTFLLVTLLTTLLPAGVLATAGLNIESQAAILRRLEDVGARTITIVADSAASGIPFAAAERMAQLSGITWVVGLGPVVDARNRATTGSATPARAYWAYGAPVSFDAPDLRPGAAYVSDSSMARLGLLGAYSALQPGSLPVAGTFRAEEPLTALEAFVLIPASDPAQRSERIILAVDDVRYVEPTAALLPFLIGTEASDSYTIERSPALLAARDAVKDEVARRDRILVVAILAAGAAVVAVVVSASVMGARRDFGRRRALGASRSQLLALVVIGTLLPALLGAAAGTSAGWAYLASRLTPAPSWEFPAALFTLTVLASGLAAALPATIAATRDPLRVLRVP
jgi:putative ABC transport system permease protein